MSGMHPTTARRSWLRNFMDDYLPQGVWLRILGMVLGAYAAAVLLLGMYWSISPPLFDVRENTQRWLPPGAEPVTGSVTTTALIRAIDTLLHKPGGYLSNDMAPPGVYLDNIPNWEYGVLIQSRDLVRALREVFSRSQSQSREDTDLSEAEPRLNFQNDSWMLPTTESKYRSSMRYTRDYLERLVDPDLADAQFYARADNLSVWLAMINTRLGSLSQRLTASVGQRRLNTDLAGEEVATQATSAPSEMKVQTPWYEIDDVFYEARGAAWALIHFLSAAQVDFADVLRKKNAEVSLRQIIRELEATQDFVWSPVILNGTGFGIVANHSLVMASYISRANTAIIDLRDLLAQG